ncbi:siderophore ABC transporter substrate-binding protein [Georgenia sp. TF02-10]|uniref:siderophore ABC transporter substrate-binding protein n=1 Tax=Georgenia sp. TF02-10 TaxID=2917725 RepID=UPI001FA78E63|nr:siderophore ABC transporter substrate-binding protein [Georgenia sp. TF02-10]UNX53360.1 siderophore ABC transporter substrate-binding protein [Georgenia sp. TF02-10]
MSTLVRRAAVAVVLVSALAACSAGGSAEAEPPAEGESAEPSTITVEHAQGSTEVPADPERVAVFDMGALDTLDTLDVDVVGVPKASVPSFLEEYTGEEYTDVGTLFEPDYEALARLDPDLVVVGFRSAAAYPELSKSYPTVDVTFDSTDFLAGLEESAGTLGEIFGKEDEVAEALAGIDQRVEEIRPAGEAAGTGMVLQTSGGEVTMNGAASRFGLIFTVLGVAEAAPDVASDPHGEVVSFEVVRDANPDWLFVNDRDAAIGETGGQAAEQILDNELVAATTAWQQDQVVYLDGERWYIVMHGLSNVEAMIDEVGQALGA